MGAPEPAVARLIPLAYGLLGLATFFTTASSELRAWPVPRDTPAQQAAGKIHSDMERGFIRAEVVALDDLVKVGGMAEARRHGLLRLEGKTYPVQDGDVITFLFNV
jgi:ribosome-binding ATPase YchF (GTP1/OBG family)